jgi:hypothetical protein
LIEVISTSPLQPIEIPKQPIKGSPEILRGNFWRHLQLKFNPPLSLSLAVVSVIVQSAQDIINQARIVVRVPGLTRRGGFEGDLGFNTAGNDWLLFEFFAHWNATSSEMTFQLREGAVLAQGRKVLIRTEPGEFRLPIELKYNDPAFTVECRSSDNVDEIIPATPVFQSDRVPHVRGFYYSEMRYEQMNDGISVHLTFQTHRPMFIGTEIYVKLPGFSTPITSIPLDGDVADYFYLSIADFNIPRNLATLRLEKSLYSNERNVTVILRGMQLPPALYENDPSIMLWTSDDNAIPQPVLKSPPVGGGEKRFIVSEIGFQPELPDVVASINILVQPSIDFYEANEIVLYLHGFDCPVEFVPLIGPDAFRFSHMAQWDGGRYSAMTLRIAPLEMVSRFMVTNVTIDASVGCLTPRMLSKDDGILSIESSGAIIRKEAIQRSPAIGSNKYLTSAILGFEPADPMSITKLTFSFTANADILPNSTLMFRLGGLQRRSYNADGQDVEQSGYVTLSGVNAPSFVGSQAYWNNDKSLLTAVVVDTVLIGAGKQSRFFIERDQNFQLPYAMYQQDPSLLIGIPASGMKMQNFNYTTRVNREGKRFRVSQLFYGEPGGVAYPGRISDLRIKFQPNVALREGTVVRLHLPGFICPLKQVALLPLNSDLYDKTYQNFLMTNGTVPYADWDEDTEMLDFTVAPGKIVKNNELTLIYLAAEKAFMRLPMRLDSNDPRLTIQTFGAQIIREEFIKESDAVVPRQFDISRYFYTPEYRESTFFFRVGFMATVDITEKNPVIMHLPGFRNILGKDQIHITGPDGHRFELPMGFDVEGIEAAAQWSEEEGKLKLWPKKDKIFVKFELIQLTIEESQGFILPRTLYRNDERLLIESENNILPEPVRESPLIGDGPYERQRYCLVQYEKGTRTSNPRCRRDPCFPPLVDPCSARELERCLCDELEEEPGDLTIFGFQMYAEDVLGAIPIEQECTEDFEDHLAPGFKIRNSNSAVTKDREELTLYNVTSAVSGYFRLCVRHFSDVYDVGTATVRPSCSPSSLVMVEGICVQHCPPSKIPVAGECIKDPVSEKPVDKQAVLVGIKMSQNSLQVADEMFAKDWEDPERQQFVYQFQSQLSKYLDTPMDRFRISSISNGSVIVNVVLLPVPGEELESGGAGLTARSPEGLMSLLRSLQLDESSSVYESKFFQTVVREYQPPQVRVYKCADAEYRTSCPYNPPVAIDAVVLFALGTISGCIILLLLCAAVWRMDADIKSESMGSILTQDTQLLDPSMQSEFARSWLENRHPASEKEVKKTEMKREMAQLKNTASKEDV